jgi:hypothetical protein
MFRIGSSEFQTFLEQFCCIFEAASLLLGCEAAISLVAQWTSGRYALAMVFSTTTLTSYLASI